MEKGYCNKDRQGEAHHVSFNTCMSVHAEMNAIISAARRDMIGGTIYLTGRNFEEGKTVDEFPYVKNCIPCVICKRLIMNSGLKRLVTKGLNEKGEVEIKSFMVDDLPLEDDNY